MRHKRDSISKWRVKAAKNNASKVLKSYIPENGLVLSYASFGSELCIDELNYSLSQQKRLLLPLVVDLNLWLYRVTNLKTELLISKWGILEPNPTLCERISPQSLDFILVPGLAFDPCNHRLGYGKGHYDRLLSTCKETVFSLGVGFNEQKVNQPLPVVRTDVALSHIALF